jgi:FdhE protein
MTSASAAARQRIEAIWAAQPEAAPLLALLATAVEAIGDPIWDDMAGAAVLAPELAAGRPVLAGAVVPVERAAVVGLVRDLMRRAAESEPDLAMLGAAAETRDLDGRALLAAILNGDDAAIERLAAALDVAPEALATVGGVAAMPPLQALRRRFGALTPPDWDAGTCPVCGAWTALAERRGLERERRLRCGRCGADWPAPPLRCAFCGETAHDALGVLAPEGASEASQVETCDRCHGALKSLATLRAWAPDEVALADLASVELDLAALERGYSRPEPPVGLGLSILDITDGEQ